MKKLTIYESSKVGAEVIRGRCFKCNIRHDFPAEYREDLLLRWIEEVEERSTQTKKA